ncbi:hypothetical protein EMIHUDRAFT_105827 [Emiliania huxleyi CCMP1516]|uniref:SSD domain-containing protein n=2 Tax=Emiliania huxleyi TaxID=2903 RepID=A0A0D3IBY0_EMIH1|nr:hypothetical protein EMIHUDRAFT_105827 [Emiliania huxleyi CCMP1516]EOD08765.1 hypothetical protein EMIHUDRAFT_105827 [Emiliania huxleyi CCMP1516]|eukprot:XP_005761194.1 hypothetical protein EMIHUDRAFT_105827 [Emiliania huxleyi CCMP1516]
MKTDQTRRRCGLFGGCLRELEPLSHEVKPPLRIVKCIVACPCLIAFVVFATALAVSVELEYLCNLPSSCEDAAYGPVRQRRSLNDAVDSVPSNRVAGGRFAYRGGRALERVMVSLAKDSALPPGWMAGSARTQRQVRQSEDMASALFSIRAEDDAGDAFSRDGLAELCGLHQALLGATDYDSYCKRELVQDQSGDDIPGECQRPMTPLPFFFGPLSYDPSIVDLAAFDVPTFDLLMVWMLLPENLGDREDPIQPDCAETPSQFGCTVEECQLVLATRDQLFGKMFPQWIAGRTNCSASRRKDPLQVKQLVAKIRERPSLDFLASYTNAFFDKDFTFSTLRSRYTRAYYHYGAPLCPPDLPPGNCYDAYVGETETAAQQRLFADWWDQEKMRDAYDPKKSELLAVAINDGILAVVPVIIVFFIVWLHTGSLLLASATLGEQFLSLLVALAVDAAVLQIKWIPFQHILSLYIVLAIGADDVFVFVDAWKQSFYAGPDVNRDLATRMSWVYRRAGLAMLITSLTTCASFIATAIASGQIPDLQNFGIFTALVIFIDYTLVMTWFTAIVVVWHNNFEMKPKAPA